MKISKNALKEVSIEWIQEDSKLRICPYFICCKDAEHCIVAKPINIRWQGIHCAYSQEFVILTNID